MHKGFRTILKEAFDLTVRNPFLWILGVFASLSINTGLYEGSLNNILGVFQSNRFLAQIQDLYASNIAASYTQDALGNIATLSGGSMLVTVLVLVLAACVIYITLLSQIGLIKSVSTLSGGKKITLINAYRESRPQFWSVLVLHLISKAASIILFVLISLPILLALLSGSDAAVAITTIIFFILFVPITLIVAFVTIYAINFIVLKQETITTSIRKGWDLLRKNPVISLEIGVVLLVLKLVSVLVAIALGGLIFIPIAFFLAALLYTQQLLLFSLILFIGLIAGVFVFILITSIFTTFYLSAWTILFEDLTANKLLSKLERMVVKFFSLVTSPKTKAVVRSSSQKLINELGEQYKEAKPLIKEALTELEKQKPKLDTIKKEAKRAIKQGVADLEPTIEKVTKKAEKELSKAKPKIEKKIAQIEKKINQRFPQYDEIKQELMDRYKAELEKDLSSVVIEKEPKKKASKNKGAAKSSRKK